MPSTQGEGQQDGNRRWLRAALIVALVAGCVFFAVRGPIRGFLHGQHDYVLVYASARAWLVGGNPYVDESLREAWVGASGPPERDPMGERESRVLLYPPGAFVVLAPLVALPWPVSKVIWGVANGLLLLGVVWGIARLAWPGGAKGVTGRRSAGQCGLGPLAFAAAAVWMAPAATNAGVGQTAMVSTALIVAAHLSRLGAWRRECHAEARPGRRSAVAGALLGIGTALKPQMALLFIVYEAGRGRWRPAMWGVAVCAVLTAVGALRMQAAGIDWWGSWRTNLSEFTLISDGDPTRVNPIRHHIMNLHYPLHNFTDDRDVVRLLVVAILGALSLAYFVVDLKRGRHKGEGAGELLSLSMTSVVTLLIVYHRFYDAVLLLFPLALAMRGLFAERGDEGRGLHDRRGRFRHAVLLLLLLPFLAPGAVILWRLAECGAIPERLSKSAAWEHLILPHQVWALVLMCIWLVVMRARVDEREQNAP